MQQKKEQGHYTVMATNAGKRFEDFSDAQLAQAIRHSHIETPLIGLLDVMESVWDRLLHHPDIDSMVKDEFHNDQRLWMLYKELVKG
jgi:hypothetical protein